MGKDTTLSRDDEREIVTAIVRRALAQTAPEELLLFDEAAGEFFEDPKRALSGRARDEAVGFGLDLAMMTPTMLAVAVTAVRMAATILTNAATQEGIPVARRALRRIFRLDESAEADEARFSAKEISKVHRTAVDRAVVLGIAPDQAVLLADAITGGLVAGS